MFNIGIIGCGKIAQVRHIPEYAAHPAARLTGYYDLNQERAQALAAQWGGRAYPTWEALLADPAIDAVSICAANTAHAELTIAAMSYLQLLLYLPERNTDSYPYPVYTPVYNICS